MYDPSTGRWLSEDPIEFEGNDPNLYRYVRNNPTNSTDPSGLLQQKKMDANLEERKGSRSMEADGPGNPIRHGSKWYRARIDFEKYKGSDKNTRFSEEEEKIIMHAAYNAAERIRKAHLAIENHWDEITKKYRFRVVPLAPPGTKPFEDTTWRDIDKNKEFIRKSINDLYEAIDNRKTVFYFRRTNEGAFAKPGTEAATNPMYTASSRLFLLVGPESADYIATRARFWDLNLQPGTSSQSFWTLHEFARYILLLDDDINAPQGQGVQLLDRAIDWLADRYNDLKGLAYP